MIHLTLAETAILELVCRREPEGSVTISTVEAKILLRTINDLRFVLKRIQEETIYGEKDSFDAMRGIIEERDELKVEIGRLRAAEKGQTNWQTVALDCADDIIKQRDAYRSQCEKLYAACDEAATERYEARAKYEAFKKGLADE